MKSIKSSWGVPVAMFVLATVLALIAGPKPGAIARAEGDATDNGGCVSDVYNLVGDVHVAPKKIVATFDSDYRGGLPDAETNNTVGWTSTVVLKYKVKLNDGITETTRELEVPLNPSKHWQKRYNGIVNTDGIDSAFRGDIADLDKAMRKLENGFPDSETFLGEDPTSRNPMKFTFNYYGRTAKMNGGKPVCDNRLKAAASVPINAAGRGTAEVNQPD